MRDMFTDKLSNDITEQFAEYSRTHSPDKINFMKQIKNVTSDVREDVGKTFTYYYCTFVYRGQLIECWSYDQKPTWHCKY